MPPVVDLVPCLKDNYAVLLHDPTDGTTVLVDAPETEPIAAALKARSWTLTHILVTHKHQDHVAGVEALKAASGATVIGPAAEAAAIPGLDRAVSDGDRIAVGRFVFDVIATPGHTLGHVAFHEASAGLLFAGDTLFALGCGRVFEGTLEQMWGSLDRLRGLPDATTVYCGHEYTASNARFARAVDPDNPVLRERADAVERLRAEGRPTVPTTIGAERLANPFLRADDPGLAARMGLAGGAPAAVFAALRKAKDAA